MDETVEGIRIDHHRMINPDLSQISKTQHLKPPSTYKNQYERLVMTVYQTVKKSHHQRHPSCDDRGERDRNRLSSLEAPIEASLPKLREQPKPTPTSMDSEIQQILLASAKGFPNPKYRVIRNFLNNYQQIRKRNQIESMDMLGLEVKRLNYVEKRKGSAKKVVAQEEVTGSRSSVQESNMLGEGVKTLLECKGYATRRSATKRSSNLTIEAASEIQARENQLVISKAQISQRKQKQPPSSTTNPPTTTTHRPTSLKHSYYHQKVAQGKLKFGQADTTNTIYQTKMQSYREFIFRLQFAHNVCMDLQSHDQDPGFVLRGKYRAWVGPGNNNLLVKGLLKRRFWWNIVEERSLDCQFVWTQIKVGEYFKRQGSSGTQGRVAMLTLQEPEKVQTVKQKPQKHQKRKKPQPQPNDLLQKILTLQDLKRFREYHSKYQQKHSKNFSMKRTLLAKPLLQIEQSQLRITKVHNHLQNNFFLGNKKAMFYSLKQYYELIGKNVFEYLPLTFHIKNGLKCPQYKRFVHYHKKRADFIKKQQKQLEQGKTRKPIMRNIWIVKPGQLSNRGNGITVIDQIYQLTRILSKPQHHSNGLPKTHIIQLYLDRPLLYNRRKFDLRHYMLITNLYGVVRGYWYSQGYVRTSSYEFDVGNFEREVHLTNDAVQKYTEMYGRYEPGNKLSYGELQRYLDVVYPGRKYSVAEGILPRMKEVGRDAIRSAYLKLSPNNLEHNFEILGLDFMIDQHFHPWLIEINTNPCLQISCPLLNRIIPLMVEQSLRLTLDVVFPPPCHYSNTCKHLVPDMSLEYLKYELIFDSIVEGEGLRELYRNVKLARLMDEIGDVSDDDEEYADEGQEIKLEDID